jgi:hypothetical protein
MSNSTLTIYLMIGVIAIALLLIILTSKRKTVLVVLAVVLIVGLATNPSREQHAAAVTTYLVKRSGGDYTDTAGLIALNAVRNSVASVVGTQNFLVFSITTSTNSGSTRNIGIGALGNVWIWTY